MEWESNANIPRLVGRLRLGQFVNSAVNKMSPVRHRKNSS